VWNLYDRLIIFNVDTINEPLADDFLSSVDLAAINLTNCFLTTGVQFVMVCLCLTDHCRADFVKEYIFLLIRPAGGYLRYNVALSGMKLDSRDVTN
jgi:hypothetical protein